MPLSKKEKKELIDSYVENIEKSNMLFVLQPQGLNPVEASEFKKILYETQGTFNVVKNTLFKIALKNTEVGLNLEEGENAVVFSTGDSTEIAKIVEEFIKGSKQIEFRKGVVEGKIINKEEFEALASLPSREVLLAQVLSGMEGPITGFVRVLSGNIAGFINVVNSIKDQKQQ